MNSLWWITLGAIGIAIALVWVIRRLDAAGPPAKIRPERRRPHDIIDLNPPPGPPRPLKTPTMGGEAAESPPADPDTGDGDGGD